MIGILLGSESDRPVAQKGVDLLAKMGIRHEVWVISAHRVPEKLAEKVTGSPEVKVWVAFAGLAAHLAGVAASHTLSPVVAVPVSSPAFQGLDALLSTVQMPPGTPVAVVGVDNAVNGVLMAARIMGVEDAAAREALAQDRERRRAPYLE